VRRRVGVRGDHRHLHRQVLAADAVRAGELDALEQVLTESTRTGRAAARPYLDCLRPGTEYTIKRGTPIAQAIPIRREAWQLRAVAWDAAAREQIEKDMAANRDDLYKDRHWQK